MTWRENNDGGGALFSAARGSGGREGVKAASACGMA